MNTLRQYWIRWKMLRLPWRKKFLIGQDLTGNTYWEFKDALNAHRMRRIVQGHGTMHHSDVQISPMWHQWLRQTRRDPPSMQEQQGDVIRQMQLKNNARLADERWAAKKKYIEKPKQEQKEEPKRMTFGGNPEVGEGQETIVGGDAPKTEPAHKEGVRSAIADPWEQEKQREEEKQKQTAANPGGGWQPEAWSPAPARKR